jgi:uncharacterized protein
MEGQTNQVYAEKEVMAIDSIYEIAARKYAEQDIEDYVRETLRSKPPIVITHTPCMDGYTARWACWLAHPDWEFVDGVHGHPPPDCTGRDVYMLDFSYRAEVLQQIIKIADRVTIIDHHSGQENVVRPLLEDGVIDGVFDTKHSGAYLSWQWFHPDEEVPYFVRLVEDRDLWRFELPEAKDANSYFFSHEYNFETWSDFRKFCEEPLSLRNLTAGGSAINRKLQKDLAEFIPKSKHTLCIGGCYVPTANLPYFMASEAGHILCANEPFAAVYFRQGDEWVVSLRSDENGVDVSAVARLYGGNGHKNASSFRVKNLEDIS